MKSLVTAGLIGFVYKNATARTPSLISLSLSLSNTLSLSCFYFRRIAIELLRIEALRASVIHSGAYLYEASLLRAGGHNTAEEETMSFQDYFRREWKPISDAANSENTNSSFDCNICLDFAHEPIVTLCGHLYCWPCIYKWLHVQSASLASDEHPQCPVCKADISHTTMVPLYGRGQTTSEAELEGKANYTGTTVIPPRPSACGAQQALTSTTSRSGQQLPYRNPYQSQNYNAHQYGSYTEDSSSSLPNLSGSPMMGYHHPMVGMFREMVYAGVFGNSDNMYTYPNPYRLMRSSSPRLRRQEMQADKSLNRISIFLFCCFLLCLVVF